MFLLDFGQSVFEARQRRQITQAALAQEIGMSTSAVKHIEHGRARPTIWIATRIARTLGVTMESLCA